MLKNHRSSTSKTGSVMSAAYAKLLCYCVKPWLRSTKGTH